MSLETPASPDQEIPGSIVDRLDTTNSAEVAQYAIELEPGVLAEDQYLALCKRLAGSVLSRGDKIGRLLDELEIVRQQAQTDELTGLNNRNGWQVAVAVSFIEALEEGTGVDFYMVDLDEFKPVNDAAGHEFGDEVLKASAGIIKDWGKRRGLTVARYGGDEFVMVGPQGKVDDPQEYHRQGEQLFNDYLTSRLDEVRDMITAGIDDKDKAQEVAENFGASLGGIYASKEDANKIMAILEAIPTLYAPITRLVHDQMDGHLYAAKRGEVKAEDNSLTMDLFNLKVPKQKERQR